MYLAATSAENSPNECPATMSGLNDDANTLANITECKKIAGWVTFVFLSDSASSPNIILVIENPNSSFA